MNVPGDFYMNRVKVGVCGFARFQDIVFTNLRLLEVQKTFYRPMERSTAEKNGDCVHQKILNLP
jgi:uncharacterized protein YecE (DUF72 family)